MVQIFYILFGLASGLTGVWGHGKVTTPTARKLGTVAEAACGSAVYTKLKSDEYGPIENSAAKIDSAYNSTACHLWFCRGYQYDDNTSNTRVYTPGTVVSFHVDIEAHHTGYANVSVVNLATQKPIGQPLISWPVYANDSLGPTHWVANETDFNVTIPDLGSACTTKGACAIQWWWYGYNKQTYESCVDFTTQ